MQSIYLFIGIVVFLLLRLLYPTLYNVRKAIHKNAKLLLQLSIWAIAGVAVHTKYVTRTASSPLLKENRSTLMMKSLINTRIEIPQPMSKERLKSSVKCFTRFWITRNPVGLEACKCVISLCLIS